jgi:hypothetical protein
MSTLDAHHVAVWLRSSACAAASPLHLRRAQRAGRYQLYQSDPSGNYGGWKATAIGANQQAAQNILKQEYKDDISLEDAVKLVVKVRTPHWLQCKTCKASATSKSWYQENLISGLTCVHPHVVAGGIRYAGSRLRSC